MQFRLFRAAAAVAVLWLVNGLTTASIGARLPDIAERLKVEEGGLGTGLLGQSVALVIVVTLVAPRLVRRFGARPVAVVFGALYCASTALPGFAGDLGLLFLAFLVVGAFNAPLDITIADLGGAVEEERGRPTMSAFEAMFVAGQVLGALAALVLTNRLSVGSHLALVAAVAVGLVLVAWPFLPRVRASADAIEPAGAPRRLFAGLVLSRQVLVLAAVALGSLWCEGAVVDWIAVMFEKELGTEGSASVVGLVVFVSAVLLALLLGNALAGRVGAAAVTRVGAVVFGAGMLVTALAPSVPVACAGLAVAGLGLPNAHPLALSAARAVGGSGALALVQGVSYAGLMAAKPAMGWVGELASMRVALGTTVVFAVVIALGAGALRRAS
jgi:Major Facilitator Superfamily